jgi:predicted HD phosphohydrolase
MLARIEALYDGGGACASGEGVGQVAHGLQSAMLAEADGAAPALVVAALLHDIGHMLHDPPDDCAGRGVDDRH